MTVQKTSEVIDEIFSALQTFAEAGLCLGAVGLCYGLNELCYYWPLLEARLA